MKITNNYNLPEQFYNAVCREYTYKDKRYSVTQIQKGIKEILLTRRHDNEIECDVADMIWMIFGNAVHTIFEKSKETDEQLKETKIEYVAPNGYTLSGIFDQYDYNKKSVVDWKTGTIWKVKFDDWDDYKQQIGMYCMMLNQIGLPATNGSNIMLLKDWSPSDALRDSAYPPHPVFEKKYVFTRADLDNIKYYVDTRLAEIEEMEQLADDEIPPCSPKERFAQPTKYKVFKGKNVKATKVFDTLEEANNMVEQVNAQVTKESDKMRVEIYQGEDRKCVSYCKCCKFCNYWKEHYSKEE